MGIDKQTHVLCRCDCRMQRHMAGVRWQDVRSSSEVAYIYEVEDLTVKLRQRRLRWFGHVKKAEGGVLGEVGKVRVGGRQTAGRHERKKWSDFVMEDMNLLGVE